MKAGDKVYCYRDLYLRGSVFFENNWYTIQRLNKDDIFISDKETMATAFGIDKSDFRHFFQTKVELRKLKLKRIENNDKP